MNLSNSELEIGKLVLQLQKVNHHLSTCSYDLAKKSYEHSNVSYMGFLAELKVLNEAVKHLNIEISRGE